MSRLSRISARVSIAALAAAGAGLVAAIPATAHTGQLFTVGDFGDTLNFATISQTDASLGALPTALPSGTNPDGIEIYAEAGYYIDAEFGDDTSAFFLGTWDHTTGAIGTPLQLTADWGTLVGAHALDTTPDGRLLTLVDIVVVEGEIPIEQRWLVEINGATGALTGISDLSDVPFEYIDSIATDPTTGVTWVFVDSETGPAYALTVDLADGTYTEPFALDQVQDDLGDGYILGADFDTAGTLWFFHNPIEDGDAVLARADGAVSPTVAAIEVGVADASLTSLAYDPYVAPQLAATGVPVLAVAAGGAALLGAGALFLVTRRRTA